MDSATLSLSLSLTKLPKISDQTKVHNQWTSSHVDGNGQNVYDACESVRLYPQSSVCESCRKSSSCDGVLPSQQSSYWQNDHLVPWRSSCHDILPSPQSSICERAPLGPRSSCCDIVLCCPQNSVCECVLARPQSSCESSLPCPLNSFPFLGERGPTTTDKISKKNYFLCRFHEFRFDNHPKLHGLKKPSRQKNMQDPKVN